METRSAQARDKDCTQTHTIFDNESKKCIKSYLSYKVGTVLLPLKLHHRLFQLARTLKLNLKEFLKNIVVYFRKEQKVS